MKRLVPLLAMTILLAISCSTGSEQVIWYGVSDRVGFMIAWDEGKDSLLLATIGLDVLSRYRSDLASQGVESDSLGAVGSLFGRPASHYLRGDAHAWDALASLELAREGIAFDGIRPTVEALASLTVKHAGYLSKSEAEDTLGALAGPRTAYDDIAEALRSIEKRKPTLRVFDMSRFLPVGADPQHLRAWITEWTDQALR